MYFCLRKVVTWLLVAEHIHASNLCDRTRENPDGSKEEYKETVGPWLRKEIEEWNTVNSTGEDPNKHLWRWLAHKYAPSMAHSEIGCDTTDHCSIVNCHNVEDEHSDEDQYNFYRTAEAIVNVHNTRHQLDRKHQEMFTDTLAMKEDLVKKFSNAWPLKAQREKRQFVMKMAMHLTVAVTALLGAALAGMPFLGAAIVPLLTGPASEGIKAGIEQGLKSMAKTRGSWVFLNSVVMPTITGEELSAFGVVTDLMKSGDYVEKLTAEVSKAQGENRILASKIFAQEVHNLMSGAESIGGSTIADYVENGAYAQPQEISPDFIQILKDQWLASWIANIWNAEMVYIVMSDTKNCASDDRGPPVLRVCLSEYQNHVFYIYMHGRNREGEAKTGHVKGPAGYELLGKGDYARISLKDIVKSSIAHFKDFGNEIPEKIQGSQAFDAYYGDDSGFAKGGGIYHGIFSIPVCYTPDGYAISAINVRGVHSRNYPCMCFPPPWENPRTAHGESSLDIRDASSKHDFESSDILDKRHLDSRDAQGRRPKVKATSGSAKATELFLKSSGFFASGDWQHFCRHKQKCKRDKKINWKGVFGQGQKKKIKHPYKQCKGRGHKKDSKIKGPGPGPGGARFAGVVEDAIWDFEAAEESYNGTYDEQDSGDEMVSDDDIDSGDSGDESDSGDEEDVVD